MKKILKGIYRRVCRIVFGFFCNKKGKRNGILLLDNIAETAAIPLDNYSFFMYLNDLQDSEFVAFYLVNKKNNYAEEIKKIYGDKIVLYTAKHDILFWIKFLRILTYVRFVCESFQAIEYINPGLAEVFRKSTQITTIFTQHGITYFKDEFVRPNVYGHKMYDAVMVSNDKEKEIFLQRGEYEEEQIIKNGLFRWDVIQDESKKRSEIFVFFTHRRYLDVLKNKEECVYYKTISDLLRNPELLRFLDKNKIQIKVALHHSLMQKFGYQLFPNVEFVKEEEIQDVKKNASLLITDYSSMCFDFMIQKKPVIFYKINDAEDCLKYGYLSDKPNPFEKKKELGNIVSNVSDLLTILQNYIDTNFQLSQEDIKRKELFFYYDKQFCKRFYDILLGRKIK